MEGACLVNITHDLKTSRVNECLVYKETEIAAVTKIYYVECSHGVSRHVCLLTDGTGVEMEYKII